MTALTALIATDARINQMTCLPTNRLSPSMALDNFKNACMFSPANFGERNRGRGASNKPLSPLSSLSPGDLIG
jgi:hypothetical protein